MGLAFWIAVSGIVGAVVLAPVAAWSYYLGRSHGLRRARAVAYAVSGQRQSESLGAARPEWVACGDAIVAALDKEG